MTSPFESSVRDGLRLVADGPPGPALADRALADARRMRLRRRSLVALAAIAVVGAGAAAPFVLATRSGEAPIGVTPTATPHPTVDCRTATNEPAAPAGTIPESWPSFIGIVMAHLPVRDDYHLSSGYGLCEMGEYGLSARMVMDIGEHNEHGQLVVDLYPDLYVMLNGPNVITPSNFDPSTAFTCPGLRADYVEVYFCEDATGASPLAFGGRDQRGDEYVFALYPDGRWIVLEDNGAGLDLEIKRAIVTDPELAALLG